MVEHCSTIHVNTVVMGWNAIEALKFLGLICNSYLHLKKDLKEHALHNFVDASSFTQSLYLLYECFRY